MGVTDDRSALPSAGGEDSPRPVQAGPATYADRAFLDLVPTGLAVLDDAGRIIEANAALEELLGRAAGELAGSRWTEFVTESDRADVEAQSGCSIGFDVECRLVHPDKGERRVRIRCSRGPAYAVACFEEILLGGDPLRPRRVTGAEMLPYEVAAAAGSIGIGHPYREGDDVREILEHTLAAAETRLRYEHAIAECSHSLLMSGEESALANALDAILAATQATYGFIEMNVDDPEHGLCTQTVCESELTETGTRSHEIDEYWTKRPWSEMPDSFEHLSAGKPFAFTIDDLGPTERAVYLADPYPVRCELDIPIEVDGEWAGLIGFADRDAERTWNPSDVRLLQTFADMIGVFWSRLRARRHLEDLLRSKNEFLAGVSHELRTPLTNVVGLAWELRDRPGDFSQQEQREFIELIASESAEVANLVEDLLVAARVEVEVLKVWPEEVDLGRESEAVLAGLAGEHPVFVNIDGTPSAWADPVRTRQILRNLITNALRYGGGEVRIESETAGDCVALRVIDNGPGIDPNLEPAIFDAYQRAHDPGSQPASVGLGLTVSRRLAELMGGTLMYRRRSGESVFELRLPTGAPGPATS